MSSPITASDFQSQNFSSDVCERLRKLLEINDTLREFFGWMFNDDGTLTDAFKVLMQDVAVAVGTVLFRPIATVPNGYLVCNGQVVSRTLYPNLFAVIGTTFGSGDGVTTFALPSLQGKFLLGAGPFGAHPVGSTGGSETVTLSVAQMPTHTHAPNEDEADGFLGHAVGGAAASYNVLAGGDTISMAETGPAGSSQPHDNMPPYFAGYWLIKT